jgi:hypothetical protein
MDIQINYQGHEKRTKKAQKLWQSILAEYNSGVPAEKIRTRYINPKTGKHYSRSHIYWALRRLKEV